MYHTIFPYQTIPSQLPVCGHLRKRGHIKRTRSLSVDCYMIGHGRNGRRYNTGCCLLIDAAHHIVHRSGDILSDGTADSHTRHHSGHIKAVSIATQIHITGTIGTHLTKSLRTCNANVSLLLYLESTDIGCLRLLVHSILAFFTLDTQTLHVILRLGFDLCCGNILCDSHKLAVSLAVFVDLNGSNIHTRNQNTEVFLQPLGQIILHYIINLCCFGFNLNHRDIMGSRGVSHCILHIPANSIPDLLLKILKLKIIQTM